MDRAARVVTTAAAFVVAGVGATVLKDRARERRRMRRGEQVPFGSVHSGARAVAGRGGLKLNVEIDEPDDDHTDPTVTVVFLHGWMCSLDTWHYQRLALRGEARLIFVDHRSHGRSDRSGALNSSLNDLAADVDAVLTQVLDRSDGPVILVGHSMGGMTIQQLAIDHPTWFADRVLGVVLLGTSSGQLMATSPALQRLVPLARRAGRALDWGRGFNSYTVMRRWALGPEADPMHVDMVDEMISQAPSNVIFDFYPNFVDLDLRSSFPLLADVPIVVVIGGTEDQLTPYSHSRYLAQHIDGARLITAENAGHMVMFEDHQLITETIAEVIDAVRIEVDDQAAGA